MTKQVLFVHGGGGGAYEADAKLAESLQEALGQNYVVRYPQMPDEEDIDYPTWKRIILGHAQDIGESAILAGHSIGASVIIKLLTEPERKPLIAGAFCASAPFWYDHEFWHWDEAALTADAAQHYPQNTPLFLYHGQDDEFVPTNHVDMYARALPNAIVRRLPGRNHQLNDDLREIARDIAALV